jgi:hypothetical protein
MVSFDSNDNYRKFDENEAFNFGRLNPETKSYTSEIIQNLGANEFI